MSHLIGITGNPGSGKSSMARSASLLGRTAVAVLDPKEEAFYRAPASKLHDPANLDVTVFADLDWRPHRNQYDATAFQRVMEWLEAQQDSTADFVVLDPASELSDFAMHETLKMHRTGSPQDLSHGRAYTGHDTLLKQLLIECQRLHARGKTVICTFHGKMRELEGEGDAQKKKGMSGEMELQFQEQMLPVIGSSFRQHIAAPFDLWLYTKPTGFGPGRRFQVTAINDLARPAKHSVTFKAGTNPAALPNTMGALLEAIVE